MNKFSAIIIIALILSLMGCSEPSEPVIPVDNIPSTFEPVSNDNKNDITPKPTEEIVQNTPEPDFEENQGNIERQPEKIVPNVPESDVEKNQGNQGNIEPPEETTQIVPELTSVSAQINTELFSIIDMNKADAIQKFGAIKEFEWWSGAIFKHEDLDYWLGYSDVADSSYGTDIFEPAEDAVITHILCVVADIFPDQDISEKDFDETLKDFDYHDNEWYQYFAYGDISIYIYYGNDNTIDTKSRVTVVSKKN